MKKEKLEVIRKIKVKRRIAFVLIAIVILILTGVILCFADKKYEIFNGELASIFTNSERNDEKNKNKAIDIAIKKFKELDEKDINKSDLEVLTINRKGELYYFISSEENTVEIRMEDNKITRVNSVPVD